MPLTSTGAAVAEDFCQLVPTFYAASDSRA